MIIRKQLLLKGSVSPTTAHMKRSLFVSVFSSHFEAYSAQQLQECTLTPANPQAPASLNVLTAEADDEGFQVRNCDKYHGKYIH